MNEYEKQIQPILSGSSAISVECASYPQTILSLQWNCVYNIIGMSVQKSRYLKHQN